MLDDLADYEASVYSQCGEDGVLGRIFDVIGAGNRYFVEFGAWDGQHLSNTANLRLNGGWQGLLMEGSDKADGELVKREFVDAGNVNALFAKHAVPETFDLLSIDIDGNDYWIWEAVTACSPRLVIIEYNSLFGPDRAVVVPYDPEFDRHRFVEAAEGGHYYFGASLQALSRLAEQKGYRLILTEPQGVNAFFPRNDVGQEIPACDPSSAYRMLVKYRRRGHDLFEYIREHDLPLIDLDAGGGATEAPV